MEKIVEVYNNFRKKDKSSVEFIPLENRLILSQLVTNSAADDALRYAWANRSLAQSNFNSTSGILALDDAPIVEKYAREVSIMMREELGLSNPAEISSQEDLDKLIEKCTRKTFTLKQNYPCNTNNEIRKINGFHFNGKSIEVGNTKEAYNVIESKVCLANIAQKSKEWLKEEINKYMKFIIDRNKINIDEINIIESSELMYNLVSKFLIPSVNFVGSIDELIKETEELIKNNFLPVFKFSYSVSGYGVHYPKAEDGTYNLDELKGALEKKETFIKYLSNSLTKNGQTIDEKILEQNILQKGITLQKFIFGHEHSIGYFKPLLSEINKFHLNLTDYVVTDVLVDGTAHLGNVLHYDDSYIFDILKNTCFKNRGNLLHFSVEIILYLMYINEKIISYPEEFATVCVEDFGIQFIVDDINNEVGIIEFNGRTPSCNFNHYHLLSKYGINFADNNKLQSNVVVFTNAKLMSAEKFINIKDFGKFIGKIIADTKNYFGSRCELISLQNSTGDITVNFGYYLDSHDKISVRNELLKVKSFFTNFDDIEI